jgi:stage V sporulation protein B
MTYNPDLEIQQDIPLKDKLIKKGFWLYFFAFLIAPTGYIIKLIAARTMGVEDVGLFYSILGLIGIVASYNDLGLTESLQYFLPRYLIDKDYTKAKSLLVTTWVIQFVSGILVWGALRMMAPRLAEHYFQSSQAIIVLRRFCLYFLVVNLFQVMQSLFLAAQDTKTSNGIDAARMWIVVLVLILIWQIDILTVNIITLTYSWIIGLIVGIGISWMLFWRRFGQMMIQYPMIWDGWVIRERIAYAWWVFLGANVGTLFGQIDLQLALYFLGKEAAWYWTAYSSLLTAIGLITWPLSAYLFPLVNELTIKKEHHKLQLLMRYIGFWLVWWVVIVWLWAYFLGPWIAVLLFGESFRTSGELLRFAAPFVMIGPAVWFAFQYLAGIGMVRQRVKILWVGLLVNITLSYLLVVDYWLQWLVVSAALSYIVLGLGALWINRR